MLAGLGIMLTVG